MNLTFFVVGRYRVSAASGNNAKKSTDMIMPCALRSFWVLSPPVRSEALVPELPLEVVSGPELARGFDTPLVAIELVPEV